MPTMMDIVTRAYRKIGVSAIDETLTADEAQHGLDALNAMMHGWALRGVDITHTDKAADDPFPLASAYVEGTVFLLASHLSPDYMVPVTFNADEWWRSFQAHNMTIDEVTIPNGLLRMPSQYARNKYSRNGVS